MIEKPEALYGEVQGVVGYWYPEMDMDIWLEPILGKAEKWAKLKEEDPDATIILSDVFDEAIDELNELRDKLEAIKNLCEQEANRKVFASNLIPRKNLARDITKILEAEG